MTYNEEQIKRSVKKRQRAFLIKLITPIALILICTAFVAIFPEVTVVFICVSSIILSIVYLIKTIRRYAPLTLFSKEIKGINVHEHEYTLGPKSSAGWGAKRLVPKLNNTSEFMGGTNRIKTTVGATVYLRLPDGSVTFIDHLYNGQTDIYEIGDTLYKYPGTRFPIVLDRELSAMPCPLCGTANKCTEPKCITCGLKIDA